jgi:3-(3-hydroxy-phenyl)propionate hydroxylase
MTPPFAGQGLNSGFRDVANLSWKLAMVVKGNANPGILDSYEEERRDHAWQLIEMALNLGQQFQPIDPPSWKDQ